MRTAVLLVLILSALVTTSCAPSVTGDSRASDGSAIQALDEQWSATAARNDLEGTIAFYADDAVLLPPNAPIATDRKSVRESWAGLLGPNNSRVLEGVESRSREIRRTRISLRNLLALDPGSKGRTAGP